MGGLFYFGVCGSINSHIKLNRPTNYAQTP